MKKTVITALLALVAACGGSDGDDSAPAVACNPGAALTLGAPGAAPACIRAPPGTTVTLTNSRATPLEVRSAPHPTHGSCPEIDETAPIPASGSVSIVMRTAGTCRFHDHATGEALGTIQAASGNVQPGPY
jgi:hypothetical protein